MLLQRILDEKVYMTRPFSHKGASYHSLVCKLKKIIYGLKQYLRA
jgi:hypothetical protein